MGIQEFGAPPVTRLAVPIDVAGSIAQALRHRGFRVVHTSPAPRTSADHSISVLSLSGAADFSSNNAVILILGADSTQSLFAGRTTCASQRRLKAYENHAHESAVASVHSRGAGRVLVICDARQLSFGKRIRAVRWIRDLAHRIGYENSINGNEEVMTSYAVVDTGHDVHRIADAVAKWGGREESRNADRSEALGAAGDGHNRPLQRKTRSRFARRRQGRSVSRCAVPALTRTPA